jgi:hypothetical protein
LAWVGCHLNSADVDGQARVSESTAESSDVDALALGLSGNAAASMMLILLFLSFASAELSNATPAMERPRDLMKQLSCLASD